MIKRFKGRTLNENQRVRIYRNLHGKNYSIKQNNVVVAHCDKVMVYDCRFVISNSGQQRVRITNQKNVHAFIEGYIDLNENVPEHYPTRISYNPRKDDMFVASNGDRRFNITSASIIVIGDNRVTALHPNGEKI